MLRYEFKKIIIKNNKFCLLFFSFIKSKLTFFNINGKYILSKAVDKLELLLYNIHVKIYYLERELYINVK